MRLSRRIAIVAGGLLGVTVILLGVQRSAYALPDYDWLTYEQETQYKNLVAQDRVQDESPGAPWFGRAVNSTYYANRSDVCGWYNFTVSSANPYNGLTPDWDSTPMTVDSFIESFRVRLNSPVDYDQARASALINMMMGINGNDSRYNAPSPDRWRNGVAIAKANWAKWEQTVRYYAAEGRANFNAIHMEWFPLDWLGATENGCGDGATPIPDTHLERLAEEINDKAVQFFDKNGVLQFSILKKCANVMGLANLPLDEPEPPKPPQSAECGAMPLPGVLPLNSGYTLRPTAKATNYAIGPSGNPRFTLWVKDPTGTTNTYPLTYTAASGTMTASYNFVGTIGGIYHFQWYLQFPDNPSLNLTCRAGAATPITTPSSDPSNPTHPSNPNNPTRPVGTGTTDQIKVGYQPFFSVVGGDISAGVPGSGPNADIRSWNANGGSYTGAGSQIGALATGDIQNFITAIAMAGAASDDKFAALAFSNIGGVTTGGANTKTYGGGFQATPNKQVPNVSGAVARPESSIDVGSLASGVYLFDRDLTITGTVGAGKSVTVVVTSGHHVIVGGNLLYSYGNFAEVPRLNVVVQGGNVYVDSGVSEIHGVFNVSNTPTPGTGMFVSCANGTTPVDLNTATGYARCNTPLTIFGSVTAQSLLLNRTTGHWATGGSGSAETFVYSPEIWLAPRAGGSGTGSGTTGNYESYISLPPVL